MTSPNLKTFFKEINQLNSFDQTNEYNDDNTHLINCKYVDLKSFNYQTNEKKLSLFHTNIGSLKKYKDELHTNYPYYA